MTPEQALQAIYDVLIARREACHGDAERAGTSNVEKLAAYAQGGAYATAVLDVITVMQMAHVPPLGG